MVLLNFVLFNKPFLILYSAAKDLKLGVIPRSSARTEVSTGYSIFVFKDYSIYVVGNKLLSVQYPPNTRGSMNFIIISSSPSYYDDETERSILNASVGGGTGSSLRILLSSHNCTFLSLMASAVSATTLFQDTRSSTFSLIIVLIDVL